MELSSPLFFLNSEYIFAYKYRINTENGGFNWLEADVRGIYPTYLIVEEVSKTIEIINSRMYLYTSLEFIISIVF